MKYAVAYINFFDNELNISFVEADSVKEAVAKVLKYPDMVAELPEDLEGIKKYCFNADCMMDVKEIPS